MVEANNFACSCDGPGFCEALNRNMPESLWKICSGNCGLSAEKITAYQQNWIKASKSPPKPSPAFTVRRVAHGTIPPTPQASKHPTSAGQCAHLGPATDRREICQFCGRRGKLIEILQCAVWGECSVKPYKPGQPEQSCRGCKQFEPLLQISAPPQVMPPKKLPGLADPVPEFAPGEWNALPPAEKAHYRNLKRERRRLAESQQDMATPQAPSPVAQALPRDKSPFLDPATQRPVFLNAFGQNAAAFVVLGGPSLSEIDLSLLSRRGTWSIGVNNAPTLVRTNAWTSVDPPSKFHSAIWLDPAITKFVHRRFLQRQLRTQLPDGEFAPLMDATNPKRPILVAEMPGVVAIDRNADFEPSRWLSEPSINWGHSKRSMLRGRGRYPHVLNSMLCVLKITYALGFKIVYLLGADFSMDVAKPYAFDQAKSQGACQSNNSAYPKLGQMLGLLQPHFLAAGFRVFNCNPASNLTVFPFVSYTDAIAAATSHIPQGVLSAAGWYNIGGGE